jgi:hypothetical protein
MLLLLFRIDIILYQQEYFAPSKLFATPLWLPLRNFEYNYEDTWEALRVKQPKVEWSKLVWLSFPIPRHYFFLLLAICDSLGTGDRLLKLGMIGEMKCYFCRSNIEC